MTDRPSIIISKIVSGAQTGADRGGLQAAVDAGVDHGGWCPRGRRAEDGEIPMSFSLTETETSDYCVRTRLNVCKASATLVFTHGELWGGSLTTVELCREKKKPFLWCDLLSDSYTVVERKISRWLVSHQTLNTPELPGFEGKSREITLNVAGSRESTAPGIYRDVYTIVKELLNRFGSEMCNQRMVQEP